MDQVRRSVVRICFDWKKKEGYRVMVIPGVILSIDNGNATIAANSFFFKKGLKCEVSFPNDTGYEDGFNLSYDLVVHRRNFSTFTVRPSGDGYIRPIKLETQVVNEGDEVNAFVFPRESYITSAAYPEGFILSKHKKFLIYHCKMHEYGYFGSPLFNLRGDLVGITYLDKGHLQAWTVLELQEDLKNTNSTFVSNGEPVQKLRRKNKHLKSD